jgi:hypothetical protein
MMDIRMPVRAGRRPIVYLCAAFGGVAAGLAIGLAAPGVPALHGGTEPDLLDEVVWWQTDDFWQYALFAEVAYIRAAASRAGVPVRQASYAKTWLRAPATQAITSFGAPP